MNSTVLLVSHIVNDVHSRSVMFVGSAVSNAMFESQLRTVPESHKVIQSYGDSYLSKDFLVRLTTISVGRGGGRRYFILLECVAHGKFAADAVAGRSGGLGFVFFFGVALDDIFARRCVCFVIDGTGCGELALFTCVPDLRVCESSLNRGKFPFSRFHCRVPCIATPTQASLSNKALRNTPRRSTYTRLRLLRRASR